MFDRSRCEFFHRLDSRGSLIYIYIQGVSEDGYFLRTTLSKHNHSDFVEYKTDILKYIYIFLKWLLTYY